MSTTLKHLEWTVFIEEDLEPSVDYILKCTSGCCFWSFSTAPTYQVNAATLNRKFYPATDCLRVCVLVKACPLFAVKHQFNRDLKDLLK